MTMNTFGRISRHRLATAMRLTGAITLLAGVLTGASLAPNIIDSIPAAEAQACPAGSTVLSPFYWSAGPGGTDDPSDPNSGATWPAGTTAKTWTNIGGSGLDVSITLNDPFDRLVDPGTAGVDVGGDIGVIDNYPTSTNEGTVANDGIYGNDHLSWVIYSQSSDEIVEMDIQFSEPVFLGAGFTVDDIDSVGFGAGNPIPSNSFQDEIGFAASNGGTPINVLATPMAPTGSLTNVNNQTVTAQYDPGVNNNLAPTDPESQVTVESQFPMDSLQIFYSNGPDDQSTELAEAGNPGTWDGVNNGQAVRMGPFSAICSPNDASMTLEKGVYDGHDAGGTCSAPTENLTGLVPGENITYCFAVTNTGEVSLDAINIDDAQLGLTAAVLPQVSGPSPLAPGDTGIFYYETSAPAANTLNTATANANPVYPDGSDIPFLPDSSATDTASVEIDTPAIDLQKTVYPSHNSGADCASSTSAEQLPNGSAVTYCFTVTNSGLTPLTNIAVADATLGNPTVTAVGPTTNPLLPGESNTYYFETTTSGPLVNTADVTADPSEPDGTPIAGATPVTSTDTAEVSPANPAVALQKTAVVGNTCPGAELINPTVGTAISYCFEVTNTGDTYLTNATISDADIPGFSAAALVPVTGSLSLIAPGETVVVRYDTTATVDVLPNTASVDATPSTPDGTSFGVPAVTDSDTANVDVQNPALELIKTVVPAGTACDGIDGTTLEVADGSDVLYCFTVNNTGDTDLIDLTIDDSTLGVTGLAVADIAVGGSASVSHGPVAATDLVNTASATGTPADGGVALPGATPVTDSDDAIVSALTPSVELQKTVLAGNDIALCPGGELTTAGNGTSVVYCFEVTNTGDTHLDNIAISDTTLGITFADLTAVGTSALPLAPGATNTYAYLSTVNGDLLNTADVTADPTDAAGSPVPGANPVTDTDTAEVDEVAAAIDIVKTVYTGHDTGAGCAGANLVTTEAGPVTYCFVATNSSTDVHLANVTVNDATLGAAYPGSLVLLSGDPALVAPGDSVTFYYEATAAADLVNTAETTGTPADASGNPVPATAPTASDTAEVDVVAPGITIEKTGYAGHDTGASCVGGEVTAGVSGAPVTYCFEVTNTGDTYLNGVTVDDPTIGFNQNDPTLLAPGDSVTLFFESTITADLVNTADATGVPADPTGSPLVGITEPTDSDTAEVVLIAPGVSIDKTIYNGADAGASCATATNIAVALTGQTATYCFTVTNTGDSILSNVTVSDPTLGISVDSTNAQMLSGDLSSMAPGDTATFYLEAIAGSADVTNIAEVTGDPVDAGGNPLPGVTPPTDADDAVLNVIAPSITLAKTVSVDGTCPGSELAQVISGASVTYCFEITNTGDTHITGASIDDDIYGTLDASNTTPVSGSLAQIAPGETAVVSYSTNATTDVVNTATSAGQPAEADGTPLPAAPTESAPDTAEVQIVNPAIGIAKTNYAGHNTGASCDGGELVTGLAGDAVTYCFTVTNTGDVTLSSVTVDDPTLGINIVIPGALAPGASTTVHHEATIAGDLVNTATASGDPSEPDGTPLAGTPSVDSAPDTAEVDQIAPAIALEKTVYQGHDGGASCDGIDYLAGQTGDAVTYCFTVTNTGDTPMSSVVVNDTTLGLSLPVPGTIAPGATATVFAEELMNGDLVNTAIATGTPSDPSGAPIPGVTPVDSPPNTAEVDVVAPDISLEKTVSTDGTCPGLESVTVQSGDAVTYCFEVTNLSDVALSNVTLSDADLGITEADMTVISGDLALMQVGDVVSLSYSTTATADLLNTASATGQPADGTTGDPLPGTTPITDSDTANVNVVQPGVSLAKTVSTDGTCPGTELVQVLAGTNVTFCFEITNSGDSHLSNVTIDDDIYGALDATNTTALVGSLALIAPGETVVVGYDAAIATDTLNTATTTGQPSDGTGTPIPGQAPVDSAPDTAEVQVIDPTLTIAKTNYAGHDGGVSCDGGELVTGLNGDAVTYCFTVTNTGNVDLTNVTVDDADLGISLPVPGPLAPGASATVFHEATIAGSLLNTATSTGTPSDPAGNPLPGQAPVESAPDTAEVVEVVPGLLLAKTNYAGHDGGASCDGAELVTGIAGSPVTYCFTITNTGDTHLSNIDVNDADLGITLNIAGPVAPGATATVFYEATIAGDLVNTADASGTPTDAAGNALPGLPPVNSAPDTAEVNEIAPGLEIAKTVYFGHDGGAGCPGTELVSTVSGGAVTYCFVVTNTGDSTLDPVTVNDADLGITLTGSAPLAPGASETLFVETTATAALVNTAAASGVPVDGAGNPIAGPPVDSAPDTAEVALIGPALEIAKTNYAGHDGGVSCDGGELVTGLNGDAVTYCFTVTNTGDVDLTDVAVNDTTLGLNITVFGTLAPGASATVFHETTIAGSLINTATATGTPSDPAGNPLPGQDPIDSAPDTAEVQAVLPGLVLAKTNYAGHDGGASCDGAELVTGVAGSAVTYCFTVTNTGDTHLSDIDVNDADLGITLNIAGPVAPGATATVFHEGTIAGDLVNTADASGTPSDAAGTPLPGLPPVDSAPDTAEVNEVAPGIEIAKTVYAGHDGGANCPGIELVNAIAGDAVTYCFVVTNTGDATLDPITVADADLGVTLTGTGPLAPGASQTLFVETTATADLLNTAEASGTPVDAAGNPIPGATPPTATDTAEVDVIAPAITIAKTVYSGHDAGASCDGTELVADVATTPVTYCFTVTNTGDVDLDAVTIDDPALSLVGATLPIASGTLPLAPGASATFYVEDTISADLLNEATASATAVPPAGTPPAGGTVDSAPDTAEVDLIGPGMEVVKTVSIDGTCPGVNLAMGETGDPVTYCFTATNTGDTHLIDVALDDPTLGITDADMTLASGTLPLAPGDAITYTYASTITADLINDVAASAQPANPDGTPIAVPPLTDVDFAIVELVAPAITVAKTVSVDGTCPGVELASVTSGTSVTWCVEITNTGDTPLTNITVDDAAAGVTGYVADPALVLQPGDSTMVPVAGTVTADVTNTATVTGTPSDPAGDPLPGDVSPVTSSDDAAVEIVGAAIELAKTVSINGTCPGVEEVTAGAGFAVTYCFEVTNTGTTHLDSIDVTDADLGITAGTLTVDSVTDDDNAMPLAPGGVATFSAASTISGDLVNTATATGNPVDAAGNPVPGPGGQPAAPVTDDDTASVVEAQAAINIVKTVYLGHDGGASCAGTPSVVAPAGSSVTYCFEVTNTSALTTLSNVTVDDPTLGITLSGAASAVSGDPAMLAPAATVVFFHEATSTGALTNTAEATGTPVDSAGNPIAGITPPTADDTADVVDAAPGITISKTVVEGTDAALCPGGELVTGTSGTAVTYCFEVTNTGDVDLTGVTVSDPALGITLNGPAVLPAGATVMLSAAAAINGDLTNVATAAGTPADPSGNPIPGAPPVTGTDDAVVDLVGPGLAVVKTVYSGSDSGAACAGTTTNSVTVNSGAVATWCFTVTNTGDTTLDNLTLNDAPLGVTAADMTLISGTMPLAPGDTVAYYITVPATDSVDNVVVATADALDGAGNVVGTVSDEDDAQLVLNVYDVVVTKAVGSFIETSGAATWEIETVNNGPGIAPGPIQLTDTLPNELTFLSAVSADWVCTAAGQTVTCTYANDLAVGQKLTLQVLTSLSSSARGNITNTASVSVLGLIASEANTANNSGVATLTATDPLPVTGATTGLIMLLSLLLMTVGAMMLWAPRLIPLENEEGEDELS